MNSFVNDSILAEKRINMLSNVEKSSPNSSPITFSKTIPPCSTTNVNPTVKYPPSDRKLPLTKTFSCSDAVPINLTGNCLFITARQFAELISKASERNSVPIVDCRSQIDYGCERIRSSHNVNCRAKLLAKKLISKRLDEIEPSLRTSMNQSDVLVLYDQSTDARDEEKIRSLPINLVLQAARRSNKNIYIIQGGFDAVKSQCAHLIECVVEYPKEKHEQDYPPPSPDAVNKENFTMTEILPHIFVGNILDAQNFDRLRQNGITHVINSTPDLPLFWENKCKYLRVDILDLPSQNIRKHFEITFQFIDEALQHKTNNVLVHCSAGISRSPTLVLAYMIKKYQMKLEEAFHQMRQLRQIVDPNVSFILQLRDWESKCLTNTTNNESNEEISCSNSRTSSSAYCGSISKTKSDSKSHADSAIVVN